MQSLGEILDRGLYHAALEATFRARNAVEKRETDAYTPRAHQARRAPRRCRRRSSSEQRLTALVYPTLRRRPARIGEAQGGTNCQLSAHSGLPALGVPAGFTDDGVPIGVELLGRRSAKRTAVLGYAIEQTLKLRQPPFSTPALSTARRRRTARRTTPFRGPQHHRTLSFDETTSRLHTRSKSARPSRQKVAPGDLDRCRNT